MSKFIVKTFCCCKREMTLSWKLLFCIWNTTDFIIETLSALYLANIYMFIYLCLWLSVSLICIHVYPWLCIHFPCFTCYLGLKMTVSFWFFLMIRLNGACIDSIFNHSHFEVALPLFDCIIVRSLECAYIYIYTHIYIYVMKRKRPCRVQLFYQFFWRNIS